MSQNEYITIRGHCEYIAKMLLPNQANHDIFTIYIRDCEAESRDDYREMAESLVFALRNLIVYPNWTKVVGEKK